MKYKLWEGGGTTAHPCPNAPCRGGDGGDVAELQSLDLEHFQIINM